jgi:hypothetical protein
MKKSIWWLLGVVALGGIAVLSFWLDIQKPEQQEAQEAALAVEPAIRNPIEAAQVQGEMGTAPSEPLPALADSDEAMRDALAQLFGGKLEKFIYLEEMIRRFVATVDNLPRDEAPLQLMPVKSVPGLPVTAGRGESLSLSPKNAARYHPYVKLAEAVPAGKLAAVYVRFYPLFQQQYEQLGYPGKYFNDRLVEVIDHLLAAPEVQGPVLLTQPKVLYEFADPKFEQLSAGQKVLVRMGSENAAKVKAKLREIRTAVAPLAPY